MWNLYHPASKPGPSGFSISSIVSETIKGIPRTARSVAILVRFIEIIDWIALKSTSSLAGCGWQRTVHRPLELVFWLVFRGSCGTCCGTRGSWSPLWNNLLAFQLGPWIGEIVFFFTKKSKDYAARILITWYEMHLQDLLDLLVGHLLLQISVSKMIKSVNVFKEPCNQSHARFFCLTWGKKSLLGRCRLGKECHWSSPS